MPSAVDRVEHRAARLGMIEGLSRGCPPDFSLELFRRADFCRQFELKVKEAFDRRLFAIPIYLSLGTEYNAAVLSLLFKDCMIFAQHRCHSLYLAFGGRPEALRDELLGRPTGCAGGMAGSNSIQGKAIRMFGHSGLMGEQVPIACGAAFASGKPCLAVCGDASVEEDYIYPALGWAASRKLPVLFVCEDNNLSILTEVKVRRSWMPTNLARALGMPAVDIADDPWLVAHHVERLIKDLPAFINIRCTRVLWHNGTGCDGPPEWDRDALVREELEALGLGQQALGIQAENEARVRGIWGEVLER